MKDDEVGVASNTHGRTRNFSKYLVGKHQAET